MSPQYMKKGSSQKFYIKISTSDGLCVVLNRKSKIYLSNNIEVKNLKKIKRGVVIKNFSVES